MSLPAHVQTSGWIEEAFSSDNFVDIVLAGVVSGNALLVAIAQTSTTPRTYTVTDDAGNTYIRQKRFAPDRVVEIWSCHNVIGGTVTIRAEASTGATMKALAVEVSGLGTTDPIDATGQFSNAAVEDHFSAAVGEIDTSADVYCFVAALWFGGGSTVSPTAGWTQTDEGAFEYAQHRVSSGALTDERGAYTLTTARASIAAIASFKAPGAGGRRYFLSGA